MILAMNRNRALLALGATAAAFAVPATAGSAGAAAPAIADGFYSSLVGHPSADVEFHVRKGGSSVPDLGVSCTPKTPVTDSGYAFIAVRAPRAVAIRGDTLSYHGAAKIPKVYMPPAGASTTLSISLRHVNGPTVHYTYEGTRHTETRHWTGTVSSPGCAKIADGGKVNLWGPVPGE
jgi:hypothetical protein